MTEAMWAAAAALLALPGAAAAITPVKELSTEDEPGALTPPTPVQAEKWCQANMRNLLCCFTVVLCKSQHP